MRRTAGNMWSQRICCRCAPALRRRSGSVATCCLVFVWRCHSGIAAEHRQHVVLQDLLSFGVVIPASRRTTANMLSYRICLSFGIVILASQRVTGNMLSYSSCCRLALSPQRRSGQPPTYCLIGFVVVFHCHFSVAADHRQHVDLHLSCRLAASFWRRGGPLPTCSLTGIVVVWRWHFGVAADHRQHVVLQHVLSCGAVIPASLRTTTNM